MKITSICFVVLMFVACNDKPEIEPQGNGLAVFPNPAREVVNISFENPDHRDYTVVVFDRKGDILFQKNEDLPEPYYHVRVADEPVGTYHVVLKRNNTTIIRQFSKIE